MKSFRALLPRKLYGSDKVKNCQYQLDSAADIENRVQSIVVST